MMENRLNSLCVILFLALLGSSSFAFLFSVIGPRLPDEHPLILDNTDANVSSVGNWMNSAGIKGYIGADYAYIGSGAGTDYFQWPDIDAEGIFHIYAKWAAHANRSSAANYEITTPLGTTNVFVNQQVNGDRWNYLGTFDLKSIYSQEQVIRVYQSAVGNVVADALLLFPAEQVVTDNEAPGISFQGPWSVRTDGVGYRGIGYHHTDSGDESATFTWPSDGSNGTYLVFSNWAEDAARSPGAHYTVSHKTGVSDRYIDQREHGGWWNPLGVFEFDGGSDETIALYRADSGSVAADAICKVAYATNHPAFDYSKWNLTFSDEFGGTALDTNKWVSQAGDSTHILSSRWPENNVVTNGLLRQMVYYDTEKVPGKEWTSGHIWSKDFTQKYGYFETRMRYVDGTGVNNAFWLYKPGYSEIDINEGRIRTELHLTYHDHKTPVGTNHFYTAQTYVPFLGLSDGFHLYAVEWDETRMIWYFDHQVIRVWEHGGMANVPLDVRFSVAIAEWAGEITMALDGTSMDVDYVRVYEKK